MPVTVEGVATRPRVAVITPTKNRLKLLTETMASVSAQTFADWEHLIVDDGSDDGTADFVKNWVVADSRVRYLRRSGDPTGANACRNLGLRESRADLILLLDSDDLLEPGCLAARVAVMDRNQDLAFATFQAGIFRATPGDAGRVMDPELSGDDLLRFLYFEAPWQTSAPIWRRESLLALGGLDERLPSWQDVDLHVRALAAGLRYLRFADVDHHIRWQFEETKVSVEQRRSPRHLDAAIPLVEKFERLVREGPGMSWSRQRALCSLYFFLAERWIDLGDTSRALVCWRRIRERALGHRGLHSTGALLLRLKGMGLPVDTAIRKWKGWMRLRTNVEVVA